MQDGYVKPEDQEPDVAGFDFYFDAFRELSTSRSSGLDIQAIPFTAIVEYFRVYELDRYETLDDFLYCIRRMDDVYLEMSADSGEKGKKDGGKTGKGNPGKN